MAKLREGNQGSRVEYGGLQETLREKQCRATGAVPGSQGAGRGDRRFHLSKRREHPAYRTAPGGGGAILFRARGMGP
jgi:hypothetical protein